MLTRRKPETKMVPATVVLPVRDGDTSRDPWATHSGLNHESRAARQVAALATLGVSAEAVPIWLETRITSRDKRKNED